MTRQGQGMGSKGSIKEAEYFLFINLYWSLIWFKLSTTRQGRQFYVEINNTGCQLTDWCSCNTTNQAAICLFSERTVVVRWDQAKLVTSYHFRLETHKVLFKKIYISKRLNWQIISEETLQNSYSLPHFILSVSERRKSLNVLKLCSLPQIFQPLNAENTFFSSSFLIHIYICLLLSLTNSRKQECCVMSIDNDQEGGRTVRTGIKETDYGVLLINLYHNSLL